MKKFILFILSLSVLVSAQSAFIDITFPDGGDSLYTGETYSIEWDHNLELSEKVEISLYKDLVFEDEVGISSCTGSYSWTIPDSTESSRYYKIVIKSLNDLSVGDSSYYDFTITNRTYEPETPVQISPESGSETADALNEFVWHSVPDADNYVFSIVDMNGNIEETVLNDTVINLDITYGSHLWKVKAVNSFGESAWSSERSINRKAFELTDIELVDLGTGSSVDWGDFNNDGFLDIIIAGYNGGSYTRLYKNNGNGVFSLMTIPFINISDGTVRWFDHNNDGFLDIFLSGMGVTRIYENNGDETFTSISTTLPEVGLGATADFADFNNDGFTDIALSGTMYTNELDQEESTKVFKNNGNGIFTEVAFEFPGIYRSVVKWGDYNNDGLPDLAVFGSGSGMVFSNNGDETFSDINAGFYLLEYASADWGDYDNDGFLDLLINGESTSNEAITALYRNNGNATFSKVKSFRGAAFGSVNWGDFNSDGWSDFIVTGYTDSVSTATVYMNNGDGSFTDINADLTAVSNGEADWGDYDNDGKLDLVITGSTSGNIPFTGMYQNITSEINTPPAVPLNLSSYIDGEYISLNWDVSSDGQTPSSGLSYNIYIGSDPGKSDILNPESDITTGSRKKPVKGNCDMVNAIYMHNLPSGTYYWGVQSVDNGFMGSPFSEEGSFTYQVNEPQIPEAYEATDISYDSFVANWELTGDKGYYIDVATNEDFTNYLTEYENRNVYNTNFVEVSPIQADSVYYYRVRSYNANGEVSGNSNVIKVWGPHDPFEPIDFSLSSKGSVLWGDYNNDGWLDLLYGHQIYKNNGDETFTLVDAGLPEYGGGYFGDYNNDGWLDVLINSRSSSIVKIYKNNGDGTFSDSGISFDHYDISKWGDFDNDGLTDIFMSELFNNKCIILKNNGDGTFTEYDTGIDILNLGPNDWGRVEKVEIADYDNNGFLDVLTSSVVYYQDDSGNLLRWEYFNKLYDNNGDMTFTENIDHGIYSLGYGALSWGDFNNDGYLDLLQSGRTSSGGIYTSLYRNNQDGTFTDLYAYYLNDFENGSGMWIDYDNDGLLDFIITGFSTDFAEPDFRRTFIYKNNGDETFTSVEHNLPNFGYSKIAWADFNNDFKNDFVISGRVYDYENGIYGQDLTVIYKNNNHHLLRNSAPEPPMNLKGVAISSDEDWEIELSWDEAFDPETPRNALTYNVCIGRDSETPDVLSPLSDLNNGYRRIASSGNNGAKNTIKISGLEPGRYYWSVQTVDHCLTGSEFGMENYIDVSGIEDDTVVPQAITLNQNYPNPFNPETEISFSIPAEADVKLNIYNANGQLVNKLIDSKMEKGYHSVDFNAETLNSGVYFYELDTDGDTTSRKMLLVK